MELTVVLKSNGTAYYQGPVIDITLRGIESTSTFATRHIS